MNKILSLLFLFIISGSINAYPESSDLATKAAAAYNEGKYNEAISLYNDIIADRGTSAQLLYNIGNAYVKDDNLCMAIVSYSRALKLKPGDTAIKTNLEYSLSKVEDRNRALLRGKQLSVTPDEPSFLIRLFRSIVYNTSSNTWFIWSIICFITLILCISAYYFCRIIWIKKTGFFGAIIMLVFSILCNTFSFASRNNTIDNNECVVKTFKVELSEEPDQKAKKVASTLSAGTILEILEKKKDDSYRQWYKVKLNNYFIGWIPADDVEII